MVWAESWILVTWFHSSPKGLQTSVFLGVAFTFGLLVPHLAHAHKFGGQCIQHLSQQTTYASLKTTIPHPENSSFQDKTQFPSPVWQCLCCLGGWWCPVVGTCQRKKWNNETRKMSENKLPHSPLVWSALSLPFTAIAIVNVGIMLRQAHVTLAKGKIIHQNGAMRYSQHPERTLLNRPRPMSEIKNIMRARILAMSMSIMHNTVSCISKYTVVAWCFQYVFLWKWRTPHAW